MRFCPVAQRHHGAISGDIAPRNDAAVAEGVAPPAGAKLAMLPHLLCSMFAADSSQKAAVVILTTEATAAGSEQQYKQIRYIPPENLDGPSCCGRWQGRTVKGIVHKVYRRAFKDKHLKLAIEASNEWVIIPPGDASERPKSADSYIIL